jgi:hypothetical protein
MALQAQAVSCESVANFFLEQASREGRALTALQMNYLLYLAHGWHLAYLSKPLLRDWFWADRYGVKPLMFHRQLAQQGTPGITGLFVSGPRAWDVEFAPTIPPEGMDVLHQVWKTYARYSGVQLARMCTLSDSPWAQAWDGRGECSLSDEAIQQHFEAKRAKHSAGAKAASA